MRQNWKTVLCFLVVLSLTALLGIGGQKKDQKTKDEEPDISQFPTVEYLNQRVKTDKQKARSKKYNSKAPPITEDTDKIFVASDWDLRLPALPVKISSAVIIGEVTDAQAYLSDDQTEIYSEFTVQIQQVLKNDNKAPLDVGNSVVVERLGGRVKFPSGKIVIASTNHQDLPRSGKRYVFFLTHEGPEAKPYEDFHILTGYELRDGQVFPLDKPGPDHPITAYKGASETSLLNELAVALADTLSQSK